MLLIVNVFTVVFSAFVAAASAAELGEYLYIEGGHARGTLVV